MTLDLCRSDGYLRSCEAMVVAAGADGAIELDRTVFYPTGGGQPGDSGRLVGPGGATVTITNAVYGATNKATGQRAILHLAAPGGAALSIGDTVIAELDWDRRYRLMRAHTGLHLLCAIVPFPVTGGQVGEAEGRLDFDIPEANLDKEELSRRLNDLIAGAHAVTTRTISDAELAARPELVRTMSVKPPTGTGSVRLVEIEGVDLQPCGGTHVANTREVGVATVTKIEKKGAINRRIRVMFADLA